MRKLIILFIILGLIFLEVIFLFISQEDIQNKFSFNGRHIASKHPNQNGEEPNTTTQNTDDKTKRATETSSTNTNLTSSCYIKLPYATTRIDTRESDLCKIKVENLDKEYGGIFKVTFSISDRQEEIEEYIEPRQTNTFSTTMHTGETCSYSISAPYKPC
ncbi:MAG: hypothetical protein ACP5D2_03300 [Candidatus Nanoarchaeia archaeon]